jgi:hypothetical protein
MWPLALMKFNGSIMYIIVNAQVILFWCLIMMTQMVVITTITIVVIDLNLEPIAKNVLNPPPLDNLLAYC